MSEQTEFNDETLLKIIQELDAEHDNYHTHKFFILKNEIHEQGFAIVAKLCSLAIEHNVHPYAKYFVFAILSKLIHPRSPPDLLLDLINQFIPIAKNEKHRISKLAIYNCVANAFYHLASEDNIQEIGNLLPSIEDDSIIFISELVNTLRLSFDVPMLALKNFVIITRIIPELLPNIISCFFIDPDSEKFSMIAYLLDKLQKVPMKMLLSSANSDAEFNDDELVSHVADIINSKMAELISIFEGQKVDQKQVNYLIQFFSKAVSYGIDKQVTENALQSIFKISFDPENTYCFCDMILNVFKKNNEFLTSELIGFLCQISVEYAKMYNIENLRIVLNVISYILTFILQNPQAKESDIKPETFLSLTEQILPFLIRPKQPKDENEGEVVVIRRISMNPSGNTESENKEGGKNAEEEEIDDESEGDDDDDDDEEEKKYRDDIMECLAYFALVIDPTPSLEMIEKIFNELVQSEQATYDACRWTLGILYKFLSLGKEREEGQLEIIEPFVIRIVTNQYVGKLASENYSSIEEFILDIFSILENKEIALTAFHLAISQYPDDDKVMEKAMQLANEYKFSLLVEIPADAPLSHDMLSKLAELSPSQAIEQRIDELMSSENVNKMQEATSLISGLLQAARNHEYQFDPLKYVPFLVDHGMIAEALKISYINSEACIQIIDAASGTTFEEDVLDRIISNALKAASENCNSLLTEKVLCFIDFDRKLNSKIIQNMIELFKCHMNSIINNPDKLDTVDVTDDSLVILTNVSKICLYNSDIFYGTASKIVESLIFFFDRIFPMTDEEFWEIIITYFLDHDLEKYFYGEYSDLLFKFFLKDSERYQAIFLKVLSKSTDNSEELLGFLNNGINSDTLENRDIYHSRFISVYKTFAYYSYFT